VRAIVPGRSVHLLLTERTVAVIAVHPVLAGAAIKTGVTLTVIDDGVARFAWVHKTTQIKMDEVAGMTEGSPREPHGGSPARNPGEPNPNGVFHHRDK
jgi:hypothetical protein